MNRFATIALVVTAAAAAFLGVAGSASAAALYPQAFSGGTPPAFGEHGEIADPPRGESVPEPSAWALMIIGFGGAGAMIRRRRDWGM